MARTAMICDDAQFMRAVIKQVLSEKGFEVVGEADSGQEAIERYTELKPDLVTMDVVMPGVRRARRDPYINKTPPPGGIGGDGATLKRKCIVQEHSVRLPNAPCPEGQSGKRDSNPRHQPWQGCALPTELFPHWYGKYSKALPPLQAIQENH